MMIIISDIPEEGLDVDTEETIESGVLCSPVRTHLRIEKIGPEVIVKGELSAEAKLQCSRCLKDFSSTLRIPVDALYHPVEELKKEDQHEIRADELDLDFYSGDELDLLNLVTEQIALCIPMKPLCSELCKGICHGCGADLNTDKCTCDGKKIDPRFEQLKKLLQ